MMIERLFVEGGFLDGLDLTFTDGLNVLIGGRKTGKTSVVELIRYCLGVPNYNDQSTKRSREHALAILQDGQATVICTDQGNTYSFRRTATTGAFWKEGGSLPIIFSQTDIETLAVQAPGRLNLIDSFCAPTPLLNRKPELMSGVASLTAQMQNLTREIDSFIAQMVDAGALTSQLNALAAEESRILQSSGITQEKQNHLRSLTDQASRLAVAAESAGRTTAAIQSFLGRVQSVSSFPPTVESIAGPTKPLEAMTSVRQEVESALKALAYASTQLESAVARSKSIADYFQLSRQPLDLQARQLRSEIEGFQQGAGSVSRETSMIREKLTQLNSLETLRLDREL